ncbi:MAG: mechanosensitive ion channel family protein [Muribaculum sp.]|nr:mechanosensitive ion channel family protein [Muribaculum sp.]
MSLYSVLMLIPANALGRWLTPFIEACLRYVGVQTDSVVGEWIYGAIVVAVAFVVGFIISKLVVMVVQKIFSHHKTDLFDIINQQHIVRKAGHLLTPLVLMSMIPFAFQAEKEALDAIERIVSVYTVVIFGWVLGSVLNVCWIYYDRHDNVRNLPLRGILNVAKGLMWIILIIIAVSIAVDKSPAVLLTGLGAFAAALMLIFRDSILGFVAGIQLSFNDMLRVGDWIVVPSTIANGIVTDVTLSAVKIRNWDNTTVTLPPYTLVSTSFQNYSKMAERGRRHIGRRMFIDVSTVRPTTPEMLEEFKKLPYMDDYITKMQALESAGKGTVLVTDGIRVNGSIGTNLGVFRAYAGLYLYNHPWIASAPDINTMVYLNEQTAQGIPLNVFCYTNTTKWEQFEGIQSDIFENLLAMAPAFGLSAYSAPTGRDVVNAGTQNPQNGAPYYGNAVPVMPAPDAQSNYMIPPNTAGDPGVEQHTEPIYPSQK